MAWEMVGLAALLSAIVVGVATGALPLPARRRRGVQVHGSLDVPGETVVALPVGILRLTYEERFHAYSIDDDILFGVPQQLEVRLRSPAGDVVVVEPRRFGIVRSTRSARVRGGPRSRVLLGTIRIEVAGAYTVSAGPAIDEAVAPRILLGAGDPLGPVTWPLRLLRRG